MQTQNVLNSDFRPVRTHSAFLAGILICLRALPRHAGDGMENRLEKASNSSWPGVKAIVLTVMQ